MYMPQKLHPLKCTTKQLYIILVIYCVGLSSLYFSGTIEILVHLNHLKTVILCFLLLLLLLFLFQTLKTLFIYLFEQKRLYNGYDSNTY